MVYSVELSVYEEELGGDEEIQEEKMVDLVSLDYTNFVGVEDGADEIDFQPYLLFFQIHELCRVRDLEIFH